MPSPTSQPPRLPIPRMRPSTALNVVLVALALAAFLLLATRSGPDRGFEVERRAPMGGIDEIRVEMRGAVQAPGVYTVAPGDRVADVLMLAGGVTSAADLDQVNLALRLRDQDQVYIPARGEVTTTLVDINSAEPHELTRLPGIGPARAAAIIAARPFQTTDDLYARDVIPTSVYEQIRILITVR